MMLDDDRVEAGAKVVYEYVRHHDEKRSWDSLNDSERDVYRRVSREFLSAVFGRKVHVYE